MSPYQAATHFNRGIMSQSLDPKTETRVVQAISYLTDAIGTLRKEMEGLRTEIRLLSLAVEHTIEDEIDRRVKEKIDNSRIDRFNNYQKGKDSINAT